MTDRTTDDQPTVGVLNFWSFIELANKRLATEHGFRDQLGHRGTTDTQSGFQRGHLRSRVVDPPPSRLVMVLLQAVVRHLAGRSDRAEGCRRAQPA